MKIKELGLGIVVGLMIMSTPFYGADPELESLRQTGKAFTKVAKKAIPAVVNIATVKTVRRQGYYYNPFYQFFGDSRSQQFFQAPSQEFKKEGLGSGVIVSEDGYVLTNNHVIDGVDEIKVVLADEREFIATIIGRDPNTDLALLKVDGNKLPFLTLGDSEILEVGEWVIAVGSPFGLSSTLTAGIVSAKGRSDVDVASYTDLIQTDAAINPGNSGGALLNIDGELVGINTAIFTRSGGYMGIGFAIPVNMAKRVMESLIDFGEVERGWIGVYIQSVDERLRKKLKLPSTKGVLIGDIVPDSPGEKAGLRQGDFITELDTKKVTSPGQLQARVGAVNIGDEVPVKIIREGKEKTLMLQVIALKPEKKESLAMSKLGFVVKNITPELVQAHGLSTNEGVVITDIDRRSKVALSRLEEGSVILQINSIPIQSVDQFTEVVSELKPNSQVLLLISERGYSFYTVIDL